MILTQCSLSCGRTADLFLVFCWFSSLFCALPKKIYVFSTRGNALRSDRQFDRLVCTCAIRLTAVFCIAFHAFLSLCVLLLCLPVFVAKCILEFKNTFCKLINIFNFFAFILVHAFGLHTSFSSSIPTEKSQKFFLLLGKIFWERKLSCTRLDLDCGNKTAKFQAGSIAPSNSVR